MKLTLQDTIELSSPHAPTLHGGVPTLVWRVAGDAEWATSRAQAITVTRATPDCVEARCSLGPVVADLRMARLAENAWELDAELRCGAGQVVELARFHYLDGTVGDRDIRMIAPQEWDFTSRCFRRGDELPAPRVFAENTWKRYGVDWVRLPDPVHDTPDWGTSVDAAILTNAWDQPGWTLGVTGPGRAFGEMGLHTQSDPPAFYAACLLDNILFEPGEVRPMETLLISWGNWQAGRQLWARRCAEALGAREVKPPLVGYCTWYQHGHGITAQSYQKAIAEFADWPIPPGGRVVQLDDGFQAMPGDWRPNEKFADVWSDLPRQISDTGSIPGLWLAPTMVHSDHPILNEHPEWLQRLPNGELPITFSNWGPVHYLDPDHPEVRAFMRSVIADAVAQGWRYLKLDFCYAISTARAAHDRKKTSFESLYDLHKLFREATGPDVILCACIGGPHRFTLGCMDTVRIGGDIGGNWGVASSVLRDTFVRATANGVWWQADPDVFYMRTENSDLSDEENRCLTGTIGLLGGAFITSDFASQWSPEAQEFVRAFWSTEGPRAPESLYFDFDPEGTIQAFRVSYSGNDGPDHGVALYNFADGEATIRVPLERLGLDAKAAWSLSALGEGGSMALNDGCLTVVDQPGHSLRIGYLSRSQEG